MASYSLEDVYCAYRQAKIALFFERRGAGIIEFAEFEGDLEMQLHRVYDLLNRTEALFDEVDVSHLWLVPKRLVQDNAPEDGIVRIGMPSSSAGKPTLEVQLRAHPSPALAIAEVLYLWKFGPILDSLLSKSAVGYRIDARNFELSRTRRWLFEYWPTRYQEFRTAPIQAAKRYLEAGNDTVTVISADLASFYDSIAPEFLVSNQFVSALQEKAAGHGADFDVAEYLSETRSLLRFYERFRAGAARITGLPWKTGVPIGALTSRIVANVALASLDNSIVSASRTISYRRYVDDFVVVCGGSELVGKERTEILSEVFPVLSDLEGRITLDSQRLGRPGSDLHIQLTKLKIHHLHGEAGHHFLQSVGDDFLGLVSERRAFLDDSILSDGAVAHLARARRSDGSPLRVLRDADRIRLEHFALSTSLASLERMAVLLSPQEARKAARSAQAKISQAMDREEDWFNEIDLAFRLLRLALTVNDEQEATRILKRMAAIWDSVASLKNTLAGITHQNRGVNRNSAWVALRDYLHERRVEAVASSLHPDGLRTNSAVLQIGVSRGTRRIHGRGFRRIVKLMAAADLRMQDREDDRMQSGLQERKETLFDPSSELGQRFATIDQFVTLSQELGDIAWVMPAHRLFLTTRPPSYFDIARRCLYRLASSRFEHHVFDQLLQIVNAIRGTRYTDPVGSVIDKATVQIPGQRLQGDHDASWPVEPRIILGNLTGSWTYWEGSATKRIGSTDGEPVLTKERIVRLHQVLERAKSLSTTSLREPCGPPLLILPELAIPRAWLRTLGNHIVKNSKLGLVSGVEYLHDPNKNLVYNQAIGVFPGPFGSVATWPWTKTFPARDEAKHLARRMPPLKLGRVASKQPIVLRSRYGDLSVLICSEIIEARKIAGLLGRVELLAVPAWNTDTSSYDHLIQSAGLQLNAVVAVANNAIYSDCRAWVPYKTRWKRDLCRLIARDCDDAIHIDIPLTLLRLFRQFPDEQFADVQSPVQQSPDERTFRPLPPDWP